jgi:hypothetical protein
VREGFEMEEEGIEDADRCQVGLRRYSDGTPGWQFMTYVLRELSCHISDHRGSILAQIRK